MLTVWSIECGPAPAQPRAGHEIAVLIGTSPIEPGQSVLVRYRLDRAGGGGTVESEARASWVENRDGVSHWRADLGPFSKGEQVEYSLLARSPAGEASAPGGRLQIAPRLWLAVLWHQHQPLYRDLSAVGARSFFKPWVRLHALRDYYAMAALAAEQPDLRLTINLTPVLLSQLQDYAHGDASDRALDLTRKPAGQLSAAEREELLCGFFDADWHHQIFIHARYRELFSKRSAREELTEQDVRDLQMWFNLAWFGKEFRDGPVLLITGEVASVARFIAKGRDFTEAEITAMLGEQLKILRAVIPLHRALQDAGQIEVATTPYFHPILPLIIDTDRATLDRSNTQLPTRFSHPEDADAQVRAAVDLYSELFGRPPRGMWPAEGAVANFALPSFTRHGVRWLASDQGVLQRSGRWGYDAQAPSVLCRAYHGEGPEQRLSLFFRATAPSDDIGFHLQDASDYESAARGFVRSLKERFGAGPGDDEHVLTLVLDGENAWGAYRDDGRPFLRALYRALAEDPEIATTTFSGYLEHRAKVQAQEYTVYDLFTGSWIDEMGSAPGVDLGTWIGEDEENRAWDLLGKVRDALSSPSVEHAPAAWQALFAAEGSDWFWWFGEDQDSGSDQEFDDLFRAHLRGALKHAGLPVMCDLDVHIVPHATIWTFTDQFDVLQAGDRLVIRTNCPGQLEWWCNGVHEERALSPVGGVMAGVSRHELRLGPFPAGHDLVFRFSCRHPNCPGGPCCDARTHTIRIR